MKWVDRFIEIFSPRMALRNVKARAQLSHVRKYEGASKGKKTKNWKTSSSSANTELIPDLQTLRDRSRALVRDNGYAFAGIDHIESDMIGDGIIPKFIHKNPKIAKLADQLFTEWSESQACDYDGDHDFYGLQSLVARAVPESGECLVKKTYVDQTLKLQVLEPDFLDSSKNENTSGRFIIGGIEFNSKGQRVAYWLFDEHPGGNVTGKAKGESKRIKASEIIPVFRKDRPGQIRGVPWLAPCLISLRDFDEYEDAELTRQKLAACFAGYITKEAPEDSDDAGGSSEETVELTQDLEPGTIQELGTGMDIKFSTPPVMAGIGDFAKISLQRIAKGLALPFEILSGNYTNVNYSSGKLGNGQYKRNLRKWRNKFFIPQFCNGTWAWFVEYAALKGYDFSEVKVTWTHPQPEPLDPLKENKADVIEVEAGISSLSEIIRRRGKDPEQVFLERAAELKRMKELGIPTSTYGAAAMVDEPENSEKV